MRLTDGRLAELSAGHFGRVPAKLEAEDIANFAAELLTYRRAAGEAKVEEALGALEKAARDDGFNDTGPVPVMAARSNIRTAIAAAVVAEREACAAIADAEARASAALLDRATKRYSKRNLLAAVGYQGDPDAECIATEAMRDMASGIATAIRERTNG